MSYEDILIRESTGEGLPSFFEVHEDYIDNQQQTQTTKMPTTIKLKKRVRDADKRHSVIFSTESSPETDKEIVDSIYFKRPFADNVKEITLTITRDVDAQIDKL